MSLMSSSCLLDSQAESTTKTPDWVDPVVEEIFVQKDEGSKFEFGEMDKVWLCAAYYFQVSGLLG